MPLNAPPPPGPSAAQVPGMTSPNQATPVLMPG